VILFVWLLNFTISVFNSWSVGKTWTETRAVGGLPHFMSWMGAIMAAVGFTWCYTIVLGYGATLIDITDEDTGRSAPLLSLADVQVLFDVAYVVIILPLLGSGLAITTHSWGVFWRRKSLTNGAVAGWNTYATLHNFYSATQHMPDALDNVLDLFGGLGSGSSSSSSSGSSSDNKGLIILVLAALAILGGIVTAAAIVRSTARSTAFDRRMHYEAEA
jgi:hypothetical protein